MCVAYERRRVLLEGEQYDHPMPKFFEVFIWVRRRGAGYMCITLFSHVPVPVGEYPKLL